MELWILVALLAGVTAVGLVVRLRSTRRRGRDKETKNIYPLW
jgi:hypothetical protein